MALSRRDVQNIRAGRSILPAGIRNPIRSRSTRVQQDWVREQLRTGAYYPPDDQAPKNETPGQRRERQSARKQLARWASYASHGKADPRYEAAFAQYWYHNRSGSYSDADIEDEADYEEDEDEE